MHEVNLVEVYDDAGLKPRASFWAAVSRPNLSEPGALSGLFPTLISWSAVYHDKYGRLHRCPACFELYNHVSITLHQLDQSKQSWTRHGSKDPSNSE